jgi:hypothetical protein
MSGRDKLITRNTRKNDLMNFHLSLGKEIRNRCGLWDGNDELIKDSGINHPDRVSNVIMECVGRTTVEADMKYFDKRQNPLTTVSVEAIEEHFKELVDTFSKQWLESNNGTNPIQRLWNRRDSLATIELFTLANALLNLKKIDNNWVMEQVRIILGNDDNNRQGAFFELIGLNCFKTENTILIPAKMYMEGIDGTVTYEQGGSISISLKNYGISRNHYLFLKESEKIEQLFVQLINSNSAKTFRILIEIPLGYPSQPDWDMLKKDLPSIIHQYNGKRILAKINNWSVFIGSLGDERLYSPSYKSYTFIILSPYHKNEQANLYSKLDETCANLSKHGKVEDTRMINMAFVHLPITASITTCSKWAEEYFANNPDKPISGIIFLQSSVVTTPDGNQSHVSHCYNIITGLKFGKWHEANPKTRITMQIPVGTPSPLPHEDYIVIGDERHSLNKLYVYQKGNHYKLSQVSSSGAIKGNVVKVASGVFEHSVMRLAGSDRELTLAGRFAPLDELLIV